MFVILVLFLTVERMVNESKFYGLYSGLTALKAIGYTICTIRYPRVHAYALGDSRNYRSLNYLKVVIIEF